MYVVKQKAYNYVKPIIIILVNEYLTIKTIK